MPWLGLRRGSVPSRVRRVTWMLPAPGPLIQAGKQGVDILHDRQLKPSSFNSMRKAISLKVSVGETAATV